MPDVVLGSVPARDAIDHIRQKLRVPTQRWDSLMGEAHAKAFTVAGAMKMDLVGDIHESIISALENGTTIADFDFDGIVAKHGWNYKGSRGWRTNVIFNTNLRTAHMAGRWKQIQRVKKQRPWMIYMTVGDEAVRPEHANWNKQVLSVDDPWWDTHYPPNGWGCRCYINTASQKQLDRQGLTPDKPSPIKTTERINTRTGEIFGDVPVGIDTGWNYNVGKAWLGSDIAFGKKLMELPQAIRAEVLANNSGHVSEMGKSWRGWLLERNGQKPQNYAHTVGYLPSSVIDTLTAKGIQPIGASIVVFDRQTNHLVGGHKSPLKRIPPKWLSNLPEELSDYKAILLHKNDLVFVLKETASGKNGRAVIQVNLRRKGQAFNSVRSLSVLDKSSLKGKDYELLEGKL
ncbi:MAG: phage minor head protein [Porticoccus sp.]|nr:phage minor head protein [Porticoccus sp.]